MARPPAAAGFTPACFRPASATARGNAIPRATTVMAGASPGHPIAASSTTARRRGPTARRGASAKSSCGGTASESEWTGLDTPDFSKDKAPDYVPPPGASGDAALPGTARSSCTRTAWAGSGWPRASRTARCPRTTNPRSRRSTIRLRAAGQQPAADAKRAAGQPLRRSPGDDRYPCVLTTYRLTEHHTAGGMSRIALSSCRTPAGAVLRDFARARGRGGASAR